MNNRVTAKTLGGTPVSVLFSHWLPIASGPCLDNAGRMICLPVSACGSREGERTPRNKLQ